MGCRKGACRAFSGREQCFSRAFSGRVERLQAFHSVARLFTALIQVLAGLVIPSARSSMAGAWRGPGGDRVGTTIGHLTVFSQSPPVAPGPPHAVSTLVQLNCRT
jgi:hypothetical protein